MTASLARRQRRERMFKRAHDGEDDKLDDHPRKMMREKTSKYGDKTMRTINRSMARHITKPQGFRRNNHEESDDEMISEADDDDDDSDDDNNSDELGGDGTMYGDLVNSLKSQYGDNKSEDEDEVEVYAAGNEDDDLEDDEDDKQNPPDTEEITEEEQREVEKDVNNKYDALNLHFNDEDRIANLVSKYEKQSKIAKRLLKLSNKSKFRSEGYEMLDYRYNTITDTNSGASKNLDALLKHHNVRQRIQKQLTEASSGTKLEETLINSLLTYQNVQLQYSHSSLLRSRYQSFYLLHCLNHVLKTRSRVLSDNEKKKRLVKNVEEGKSEPGSEDLPEFRDQGYTRPKVLIILPTRNSAWELVNKLIKLSEIKSVESKKRFKDQYYDSFGKGSSPSEVNYRAKPADFKDIFKGNSNDFFCLGIKLTRKTVRLYSKLDQSDFVIASPLGLKMLFERAQSGKHEDTEFLSSIEITVMDKCEGLLMQNWQHVSELLTDRLNAPAKNFDEFKVDFSRVRMWAINDQYKFVTQMLVFGKYGAPELNSIVMDGPNSHNLQSGTAIYKPIITGENSILDRFKSSLTKIGILGKYTKLKQVFMRFDIDSIETEPDKRFEFFKNVALPQILNKASYNFGTLVYVADYVDYIRLVNYLRDETSVAFVAIDEYSSQSKLTRSRAKFAQGANDATLMLYTERLHFYKRYLIKGVRNVLFYQLPKDPDFYSQVLQFLVDEKIRAETRDAVTEATIEDVQEENDDDGDDDENDMDLNLCMIRTLFDRLDIMRLEKVVGLGNAGRLCNGESEVNQFT